MKTWAAFLIVACCTAPAVAAPLPSLDEACADLDDGRTIRALLSDGRHPEGAFAGCTADTLFAVVAGRRAAWPADTVVLLEARRRATSQGIGYGGLLGGCFFGAVGLAMAGSHVPGADLPAVVLVTGLGGLMGGAAGALVGTLVVYWERIYEDVPPQPVAAAQAPVRSTEIGGRIQPDADVRDGPSGSLALAYADLEPGQTVQLNLVDGSTAAGRVAGWDGRRLHLLHEGELEIHDEADVLAVWARERSTRLGASSGAVLGSLGGAGFMTLMAIVMQGMDDDGVPYLPMLAGGALAGGLGGGLVGAGVGAALPRWKLRYAVPGADPGDRPRGSVDDGPAGGMGSLSMLAGMARNQGVAAPHADFAWRVALNADWGSHLSVGPEIGRYLAGPAARPLDPWPEPDVSTSVWHAGAAVHAYPFEGPVKPYASAGMAYYGWNESFLGWNAGAGLRLRLTDGADWIAEYRYHANLQRLTETEPELSTLLAGVAINW
jgi:hypothetical protein